MSTAESSRIRTKLASLSSSLDDLESLLEPVLSQSLPETLLNLEPLQQAKLQTVLPYVVYDLVFIHLKLEGIDPKTHPIISELDRIRQYFEKISNTENPPARRAEIDKAAAGRFIKHAIASVKWTKTVAEEDQEDGASSATKVPVKVTRKMLERQRYEEELKKQDAEDDGEDDDLEVFNDAPKEQSNMEVDEPKVEESTTGGRKRQRQAIDPFAGYGDDVDGNESGKGTPIQTPVPSVPVVGARGPSDPPKKKKKSNASDGSGSNKKKSKATS